MSQNGLIRLVASPEHGVERRVKGASENIAARGERIVRLEACRGIAALVVVFHHIIAAFAPTVSGILAGTRTSDSLAGTVFFVAINGTGAVVLFFVLSGYVLTARFFANPDADFMAIAALKRLPRLALLTTIVTFGSALLFLFGLYHFAEASQVTGSEWLRRFALTDLPNDFQPSLLRALAQGAWLTFTTGESYLDSSLWTMAHELRGSIVVFVAAPFLVFVLRGRVVWLALIFVCWIFRYANLYMIAFICGMAVAYYQRQIFRLASPVTTAALLIIGLYCLGYVSPERDYMIFAKLAFWNPELASHPNFRIYVWTIGATSTIVAILQSPVADRILNNKLGTIIGRLSFPIYLVHVPIICSASCVAYLHLLPLIGRNAIFGTAVFTLILTIAVAWPLAWIDVKWVRFLNARIGALLRAAPGR